MKNKQNSAINAFENGPLFHLFHDDKAQVAVAHDIAPLDAMSQNWSSTGVGGHRSDLINKVVGLDAKPEGAGGQGDALKAINCITPTHNPSENTGDATTPPPDHGNDDQASAAPAIGMHNDCTDVGVLLNLQTPVLAGTVAAAASSQVSIEGSQGNSLDGAVITTDAYHLTAPEVSAFSTETVLLSTAPVPVNVALEQAFVQAGFGSAPSLGGVFALGTNAASSSGATTHAATADVTAGAAPTTGVVSSQTAAPSTSTPSIQTVEHAIEQFLASTPSAEVALSGANVVIIDTNVADAKSPDFGVMTWDMSDGSTVSIVGILPSSLHAASLHGVSA